jgi:hypothetical protein
MESPDGIGAMQKHGVKFGCLSVQARPLETISGSGDLGHRYFLEAPWSEVELESWTEDLGRWQVDEIRRADVWIWSVQPSSRLAVADAENVALERRLHQFWLAYMLHRPLLTHSAWSLTGTLVDARPNIRTMKRYAPIRLQEPWTPRILTVSMLREIASIADRIDHITSSGLLAGRLARGWAAFVSGMKRLIHRRRNSGL